MTEREKRREKLRAEIASKCACPTCGADIGERCRGKSQKRKRSHEARVKAYQALINPSKKKRASAHKKKDGFYSSWEWKKVRYEALRIHGHRCQCCGWRPGDTEHGYLVVDHIKPRSKYPELELVISNTQVLCNDCNMGKSNIFEDDFRKIHHATIQ